MATQEIERLEKRLDIYPKDLENFVGMKAGKAYYQRKHHPKAYKAILLGIRMVQSPMTVKEILDTIEPVEKIITRKGK